MKLAAKDELCSGCRTCELVCALATAGENNPRKAALRIRGIFPDPGRYQVVLCDQCGECAEACPVGCIEMVDGHYRLDAEMCNGCLLCVEACPRGAMFVHPVEPVPFKCTLCGECVEYCPRQALYIEREVTGNAS